MKRLKTFFAVSFLAALCILSAACGRKEEVPEGTPEYTVYYLDSSGLKLVGSSFREEETDQEVLVQELLSRMETVPAELDCQSAIPDRVETITFRIEKNVLYLFADANYALMDSVREILCRAALTKTLTQIEGIDYLSIYCAEQPIVDGTGNPVGMLSASDFVEGIRDVNSFERTELTLYFANEEKDGLVAEKREVFHSMNTSLERLVVEQLLAGSQNGGLSVMPKNTKVLNVSLTDNTCYVNLDSSFISGDIDVAEYIPIYAIVDSLTELQTVNKVQITVNGSADVTYRNVISLVQPLEREEKYIVK